MAKYRFQFQTGNIQDGSDYIAVSNYIGEIKGEVNPSMALTIKAHGGQLVTDEPKVKTKKAGSK